MNPGNDADLEIGTGNVGARKPYNAPQLTELGPIEELVQGVQGTGADSGLSFDCQKSI